jgi:DNA polymerase-3 subunit gamma/tau
MSYQVLARKWRPHSFKEMVGQAHVLQALINALDQNRLHHAYLFTGTRGVGKTTIARIFAKCLNCESGVSSQPCGQCSACTQVDAGNFIDLIEVDAASRTRVEDTRELLDNVQYAPSGGRYKVYLIDEVHMLSGHSFNALLKTLEEPPPHVKFLLATTDPQKLPVTILSRCLQFNLKAMTPERIVGHLQNVLEQEVIGFDEPALWEIARAANGSMRDALSLTDQAIAYGNGQLQSDEVRTMLGTVDRSAVLLLLQRLAEGDAAALLQAVAQLSEQSPDYNDILAELITLLHRLSIAQAVPGYSDDDEKGSTEADVIRSLAAQLTAEDVQLFYQIALLGRKDMPLVPDARRGLEMVLLRMLLFRPHGMADSGSSPAKGSFSAKGSAPADGKPSLQSNSATQNASAKGPAIGGGLQSVRDKLNTLSSGGPKPSPLSSPETSQAVKKKLINCATDDFYQPAPSQLDKPNSSAGSFPVTELASQAPELNKPEPPVQSENAPSQGGFSWDQLLPKLPLSGAALNLARNCCLSTASEAVEDGVYKLVLDQKHAILLQHAREAVIKQALEDYLGHSVKLKIEVGKPQAHTPQQLDEIRQTQQQAAAEQSIAENPGIQALIEQFDARVEVGSIKPRVTH